MRPRRERGLVGQRVGGPLLGGLLHRLRRGGRLLGGRLDEVGLHVQAGGRHLAGQHPGRGRRLRGGLVGEVADEAAAVDDAAVEADGVVGAADAGQAELDAVDGAGDEAVGPGQGVAAGQPRVAARGGDGGGGGAADEDGDAVADGARDGAGGRVARHVGRQHLRGAAGQGAAVAA
ncbi:hypothetical protein ACFQES_02885 [Nonomuraea salmonea]|uniref:hypothetical protein n=1 Tax=Nonomuraea salmonea TaxID=46181 RepID=UPI0036133F00